MASLIYTAICSLDGYVADEGGAFDWAAPSDEVHAYVNDVERDVGTYLYGRRMYDVMVAWESDDLLLGASDVVRDYAGIWRAADKVVHSTTLTEVSSTRTRLVRTFDVDAVRALTRTADRDVTVAGPGLAAQAMAGGLVDEVRLFLVPVLVGGGTKALPDRVRRQLRLDLTRTFADGTVHLRYGVLA